MPIKILHVEICIVEAERFLARAKLCLKVLREKKESEHAYPYGPLNAAVRRSSMDLTRALAALRKY